MTRLFIQDRVPRVLWEHVFIVPYHSAGKSGRTNRNLAWVGIVERPSFPIFHQTYFPGCLSMKATQKLNSSKAGFVLANALALALTGCASVGNQGPAEDGPTTLAVPHLYATRIDVRIKR